MSTVELVVASSIKHLNQLLWTKRTVFNLGISVSYSTQLGEIDRFDDRSIRREALYCLPLTYQIVGILSYDFTYLLCLFCEAITLQTIGYNIPTKNHRLTRANSLVILVWYSSLNLTQSKVCTTTSKVKVRLWVTLW